MINKRLLIKNLLAHNDECSFYDKKRQLNLHTREGKAKFLKHICALSNSNPTNNSYIVVGVEDQENTIVGDDFFDDSRIQNLVNAYLENPPQIQYENVPFPNLPKDKVVGLVTIKANDKASSFKKVEALGNFRLLGILADSPEVDPNGDRFVDVQVLVSDIEGGGRTQVVVGVSSCGLETALYLRSMLFILRHN